MAKGTMTWDVPATTDRAIGSMAGNLVGSWFPSANMTTGHTLAWTGTPVGVFSVDLSNDGVNVDHTLTAADIDGMPAPAGGPSRGYFEIVAAAPYRRVNFTSTSGTGTLTGNNVEGVA